MARTVLGQEARKMLELVSFTIECDLIDDLLDQDILNVKSSI